MRGKKSLEAAATALEDPSWLNSEDYLIPEEEGGESKSFDDLEGEDLEHNYGEGEEPQAYVY